MLSFFPRGVLDEICDLIESVFEGFLTYSLTLYVRILVTIHVAFSGVSAESSGCKVLKDDQ